MPLWKKELFLAKQLFASGKKVPVVGEVKERKSA
jgi:hypothetical protein